MDLAPEFMKLDAPKISGFTLVELAVVMMIIGIVMTMGLKMVNASLDNVSFSETKAKQERIKLALLAYLRTNGTLPCPDNSGNAVVATGVAAGSCDANAAAGYGIVPWQTLGMSRDEAIDGWGNYFSYRVANGVASKNWTSKIVPANDITINELKLPSNALTIQELDSAGTALTNTTQTAVAVLISHGKNGFGAKTVKTALRMPVTDAGTGEITNATVGSATFVLRPVNEATGAFNGPYDDLVAYMQPRDLLQPLITEGTLKACVAYCSASITSSCSAGILGDNCTCTAAGVAGTPAPCSGACSTCTQQPVAANCIPIGPLPIGATPANCV